MPTIIENWAQITGTVLESTAHPKLKDYTQLKVMLEKSKDIKGFPNLARLDEQNKILINVRNPSAPQFQEGHKLKAVVRKVFGQEYFMKEGIY
ncbi:MAG: hypothetical protein KA109_00055 [Saprospiraceae bacterium]|jgi:hypothetical protein|nr:hypothetical protein [Saprospiraceae bacterium]MBK6478420.1 hypothetical protein [Saprospiraceae bacterium]MBK6813917.1 hypothetical protein [Saprospiraceae bacterium]MBK7373351.1 hypothetical protein [Saprospiraceae bacterium]MBK7437026.1 hypothetical protein [Saprospiraceae bacterium]